MMQGAVFLTSLCYDIILGQGTRKVTVRRAAYYSKMPVRLKRVVYTIGEYKGDVL